MSKQRQAKSAAWRRRQEGDPLVRAARLQGYRSRAAYKLLEIDKAHRLLRAGMRVAELGAAPGGWSQVLAEKVKNGGIAAVDILTMDMVEGVAFIHGDFTAAAVRRQVQDSLGGAANLVLSDMSPNLSGIAVRDQANAQALFNAALAFCTEGGLKRGGGFLCKVFAGEAHNECLQNLRRHFKGVRIITPQASRKTSKECYLLARGFTPAAAPAA